MSGTVDERLAAALHGPAASVHAPSCAGFDSTNGPCAVTGWATQRIAAILSALADSGVVLVEREALERLRGIELEETRRSLDVG